MSTKRIMRSFTLNEISAVDKAAQVPAEAILMKRAAPTPPVAKGYERPVLTTETDGHAHIVDDIGQGGETSWTRSADEEYGHSHPWVRMLDGTLQIGAAEGHTHQLVEASSTIPAIAKTDNGETDMTTTKTEPTAGETEAANTIATLTKRAERAEAISKLDGSQRVYFDGLNADGQTAFLGKSADQRSNDVRASTEANRVVFKSATGQEYRQNDDPRLIEMAKQSDANAQAAREAIAKADLATFTKRATEELPNLPGTPEVRAGILKALEGVPGAVEFLKAANDGAKGAFTSVGAAGGGEVLKADDQLEVMAKKYATDNKVTIEKARVAVLESPEGQKLYASMS